MPKVLVTVAAGFVGRHMVKRLLDAGDEVHGVDGVMATIDKIDDGGAVNLSTGIFTSFIDFTELAAGIAGYHQEVKGLSDKPAGVHARGGDTTKQRQLGFRYKTDFRTGVERALKYYAKGK